MIRCKDNKCIVRLTGFLQAFENPSDLKIDKRDIGVIIGFQTAQQILIDALVPPFIPVLDAVDIELKRFDVIEAASDEMLVEYIHGIGRIGVIVKAKVGDAALKDNPRVKETLFDMALHTAAFAPQFLTRDQVNETYRKEQEELFRKQAEKLGKPEKVLEGIVKGKLSKHLADICMLEQGFVKDEKLKVSTVLQNLSKEAGAAVAIADFRYYKVGEDV